MRKELYLAAVIIGLTTSVATADIEFGRDIRPILSDKCFTCHGPNEADREGGFRLDVREGPLSEADSGEPPIVPGHPEQSTLIARITSHDESERMPPRETTKQLTSAEIELLREWIEAGAPWQDHWAFAPPQTHAAPQVDHAKWPRNDIDRFVLARLEQANLGPSPPADRETLIRRLTFDLTGLPPTPAEIDEFLLDNSPQAYERLVDRLLESERYGEHMARYWLDAARYGDTHGLHLDNYREMWPYRDWVVRAFNRNLSYDRFTIEQLAGDLLPEPTQDQLIATGFNRAHVTTNEGGSIKEEVYVRNVVDRVVTFGTVFMGMTFECTRCHDHKYDPFTMNDFYSLFAYFNSLDGNPLDGNRKDHAPVLRVPTEEQQKQLDAFDQQIAQVEKRLEAAWPLLDKQQRVWEASLAEADTKESPSATLQLSDWFTVGPFSDNQRYLNSKRHGPEGKPVKLDETFRLATGQRVSWTRKPEWADGTPHVGLPGNIAANFLYRTITSPTARRVRVSLGSDDGIKVYLNNRQLLAKTARRGVAADQDSLELTLKAGENHLLLKILNYGGDSGFYFAADASQPLVPQELVKIANTPPADRSTEQEQQLREHYRNKVSSEPQLLEARDQLQKLRKQRSEVDRQVATTLIWREAKEQKPAYYLVRGEYDQRGDPVNRRTPTSLPALSDSLAKDRLGLAEWLVHPEHPLTARVAVNRFWQQLFGTGLVKTSEDFGSQGETPSHPQLLDWLSKDFMADGWNVKALMKRMVMSATYRQSSRVTRELRERDPDNRLLARGPRFRLDAEMLRDQALSVSGLLVEQLGGPSVKPPQPDGLWFAVGYSGSNTVRFKADEGPQRVHRRTLYTFIKRTAPPPQMSIMDAPSREACVVRRERTNTPLLALMLFNDPQFVEAARGLAERTLQVGGSDTASRAAFMFRLCTGRRPTEPELDDLLAGLEQDLAKYAADPAAAQALTQIGETPPNQTLDVSELAAWTVTANLLLNLDEVVTKN